MRSWVVARTGETRVSSRFNDSSILSRKQFDLWGQGCSRQFEPTQMAIPAQSRVFARFGGVVVAAACALHAVAHAASPVPDSVSLSESTITWSTVKYATDAENGFVDGSLDKTT